MKKERSSNIRRLGVRSVHYANDKVYLDDTFSNSENPSFLYVTQYENIANLNCVLSLNKNTDRVRWQNDTPVGFTISDKN